MAIQGKTAGVGHETPPPTAGKPPGLLKATDKIVLLLTNGMSVQAAEDYCIRSGGMDAQAAQEAVCEARQRITIAAGYARDEQLGKAVMRLDDLYAKSIASKEIRTALQAQRELNRLLGLYWSDGSADDDSRDDNQEAVKRLDLIAGYLVPLKLADARYPIEEHARLASEIIRTHKLAGV